MNRHSIFDEIGTDHVLVAIDNCAEAFLSINGIIKLLQYSIQHDLSYLGEFNFALCNPQLNYFQQEPFKYNVEINQLLSQWLQKCNAVYSSKLFDAIKTVLKEQKFTDVIIFVPVHTYIRESDFIRIMDEIVKLPKRVRLHIRQVFPPEDSFDNPYFTEMLKDICFLHNGTYAAFRLCNFTCGTIETKDCDTFCRFFNLSSAELHGHMTVPKVPLEKSAQCTKLIHRNLNYMEDFELQKGTMMKSYKHNSKTCTHGPTALHQAIHVVPLNCRGDVRRLHEAHEQHLHNPYATNEYWLDRRRLKEDMLVLARRQKDGMFHFGFIKGIHKCPCKKVSVEFPNFNSVRTDFKSHYEVFEFEKIHLHNILDFEAAQAKDVKTGDRVLAPDHGFKRKTLRFIPATVAKGFQKRKSLSSLLQMYLPEEYDGLLNQLLSVVYAGVGPSSAYGARDLSEIDSSRVLWLPEAMYKRLCVESTMPALERERLVSLTMPSHHAYPYRSAPGYPADGGCLGCRNMNRVHLNEVSEHCCPFERSPTVYYDCSGLAETHAPEAIIAQQSIGGPIVWLKGHKQLLDADTVAMEKLKEKNDQNLVSIWKRRNLSAKPTKKSPRKLTSIRIEEMNAEQEFQKNCLKAALDRSIGGQNCSSQLKSYDKNLANFVPST